MKRNWSSPICGESVKQYSISGKQFSISLEANTYLQLANTPLSSSPKEMKYYIHKNDCTQMFIINVLQHVIDKLWNSHRIARKTNKLLLFDLKNFMLNFKKPILKNLHSGLFHLYSVFSKQKKAIMLNDCPELGLRENRLIQG